MMSSALQRAMLGSACQRGISALGSLEPLQQVNQDEGLWENFALEMRGLLHPRFTSSQGVQILVQHVSTSAPLSYTPPGRNHLFVPGETGIHWEHGFSLLDIISLPDFVLIC